MLRTRIIPTLLLKDQSLVKTVRFGKGNVEFKKIFVFLMKNKIKYYFNLQPARSKINNHIQEILINLSYIRNIIKDL